MRETNVITAGLLALLLTSCAVGGPGVAYQPGDPELAGARLEIVGVNTFSLRHGQSAELKTRYVLADGTPIASAPIDFETVGDPADSSLSTMRASTGGDGVATVRLVAGNRNARFTVKATPPVGNEVSFLVSVSQNASGSISIQMTYSGSRVLDELTPYLFTGARCAALEPSRFPTAEIIGSPVRSIVDRPGFVDVAPARGYSVAVVAKSRGELSAFGCVDDVEVLDGRETLVRLTLSDWDPAVDFTGTWDLANRFDFGGALPPSVEMAVDVLAELGDDDNVRGNAVSHDWGQDPGAFILDMAMRLTCEWDHGYGDLEKLYTENFSRWSGARPTFPFGCAVWESVYEQAQNWINEQVGRHVPAAVVRFLEAASDLAAAIAQARVQSILRVEETDEFGEVPFEHRLATMEVRLRDLEGDEHFYVFGLHEAGLTEITSTGLASTRGAELLLPAHSFELHLGRLVNYVYVHGLLPLFGFESTEQMLATWIDCAALARSLHGVSSLLSESTYRSACESGLEAAGGLVDDGIGDVLAVGTTLTISGTARGTDLSTEGVAQTLTDGTWTGGWEETGVSGTVGGTFSGRRR
jgi:hypothetical protein